MKVLTPEFEDDFLVGFATHLQINTKDTLKMLEVKVAVQFEVKGETPFVDAMTKKLTHDDKHIT